MCDYKPEDVHSEEVEGLKLRIVYDTDAFYPRDRDWTEPLGTLGVASNRYFSGDQELDADEFHALRKDPNVISLPVYAYIHSGIRLRTGPFHGLLPQGHAEFDSGLFGLIWLTKKQVRAELGCKKVGKKAIAWAVRCLEGEIQGLNNYFCGSVYGFIIEDADEIHLDSVWGFNEEWQSDIKKMHVYQEAKSTLAWHLQDRKKKGGGQ